MPKGQKFDPTNVSIGRAYKHKEQSPSYNKNWIKEMLISFSNSSENLEIIKVLSIAKASCSVLDETSTDFIKYYIEVCQKCNTRKNSHVLV